MRTLARFCHPKADLCTEQEMYLRVSGDAGCDAGGRILRLGPGGQVDFDTYFNALAVGKLRDHTTIRTVSAAVEIDGAVRAEVHHQRPGGAPSRVVATAEWRVDTPTWFELEVAPLDDVGAGAVFLRLAGLDGGGRLYRAEWRTSDAPTTEARLGVVITAFGHEAEVKANVTRLLDAVAASPEYSDRVHIVVVDNRGAPGMDVPAPAVVLPNPNLGGAGGFTRGLMHFRATGSVTHVLFMDDDVWFEPDVVLRTAELLSFAADPNLCVAGAMLPDNRPTVQFEAGAQYRLTAVYPNRPLGTELDVADWPAVLEANVERERIDYGGWWFYAFPIAITRDNPIPIFVRGDDILWGLLHCGDHTMTMSGIAVWHVDFETKNSPTSWFYDTRNYALVSVLASTRYRARHMLFRYLNICGRSMLALKYSSAELITFGMQEYLKGPAHWLQVDHPSLHQHVRSRDEELVGALDPAFAGAPALVPATGAGKWLRALGSLVTLGGHLWPARWNWRGIAAVPVQQRALGQAPGRNQLVYRDSSGERGFVARRDRRRFFSLLWGMLRTTAVVTVRFRATARAYRAAYPEMTSDDYWRGQFAQGSGSRSQ